MFTSNDFKNGNHHFTAARKARFANQFIKFIEGHFQYKDFPEWFYNDLTSGMFRIGPAHQGRKAFYNWVFMRPICLFEFFKRINDYPCYDSNDFVDLEKAIQDLVIKNSYLEKAQRELKKHNYQRTVNEVIAKIAELKLNKEEFPKIQQEIINAVNEVVHWELLESSSSSGKDLGVTYR